MFSQPKALKLAHNRSQSTDKWPAANRHWDKNIFAEMVQRIVSAWGVALRMVGSNMTREQLFRTIHMWKAPTFGGKRTGAVMLSWLGLCSKKYQWIAYKRIFKSMNKAVGRNMNIAFGPASKMAARYLDNNETCSFTFLRNPFERFASGVKELEVRMQKNIRDGYSVENLTFHKYSIGSSDRVRALIKDIVTGRMYAKAVKGRVADFHIRPQSNAFINSSELEFVGRVENVGSDWITMQHRCGITTPVLWRYDEGQHGKSSTSSAIKEAVWNVMNDSYYQTILCLLYIEDVVRVHPVLPTNCAYAIRLTH